MITSDFFNSIDPKATCSTLPVLSATMSCSADMRRLAFRTGAAFGVAGGPAPMLAEIDIFTFAEVPLKLRISFPFQSCFFHDSEVRNDRRLRPKGRRCDTRRGGSMTGGLGIAPETREQLQKIVVRL